MNAIYCGTPSPIFHLRPPRTGQGKKICITEKEEKSPVFQGRNEEKKKTAFLADPALNFSFSLCKKGVP